MHHPSTRAIASFLLPQLQASYRYRPSQSNPKKWVVLTSDPSQLIHNSDTLPFEGVSTVQNPAYESTQQLQQGQQHAFTVGLHWKLDALLAGKRHNAAAQLHQTRVRQHLTALQYSSQAIRQLHKPCQGKKLDHKLTCWAQHLQAQALLKALAKLPNSRRQP
ncbi:MAG: hypothetical protein AAF320_01625 [Myxococcota bacterium]